MAKPAPAGAERGTAAGMAAMRRRPRGKSDGGDGVGSGPGGGNGISSNVLSFYTETRSIFKLSPRGLIFISCCFIASVFGLHIVGIFLRSQSSR